MRWLADYYRGAYRNDVGFIFATIVLVTLVLYKASARIMGIATSVTFQDAGWNQVESPKPVQAHVLMMRDTLSGLEDVWCSFDSHEELEAARDGLNRLYDGQRSFWGRDDEPPNFAKNPEAFKQWRTNWRSN